MKKSTKIILIISSIVAGIACIYGIAVLINYKLKKMIPRMTIKDEEEDFDVLFDLEEC